VLGTLWYNSKPSTPTPDPERHAQYAALQTDGRTDGQTDDIMTPIPDHIGHTVYKCDRLIIIQSFGLSYIFTQPTPQVAASANTF